MEAIKLKQPSSINQLINQLPTSTPSDLLGRFERQTKAPSDVYDVVSYGADKNNDFLYAYIPNFGDDSSNDVNTKYAKYVELATFNDAVCAALNARNGTTTVYFGTGENAKPLTLSVTDTAYGMCMEIGGDTKRFFGMNKADLKSLMEQRIVSSNSLPVFLSAQVLNENPICFMNILALSKTIAGVQIQVTNLDPTTGKRSDSQNWVIPEVTKQLSHISGVSVHAGSTFIEPDNKKPLDENNCIKSSDATTFAYVDGDNRSCKPKFVMATVDGASAKNSRIHSAFLCTAAAQTVQQLEKGEITEDQLKARFNDNIKALYKIAVQTDPQFGDDEATFTGGVLYHGANNQLKLFSFHIGDAVLALSKPDKMVTTLHGTEAAPTFMKGPRNDGSDHMLIVKVSDIDPSSEIKMGTDGIGPLHFEKGNVKGNEHKDIQCKNNFPPHGEFDSSLISKVVTREKRQEKFAELSKVCVELERYTPQRNFWKKIIDTPKVSWEVLATDNGQAQYGSKFAMPEQQLVQSTIEKLDTITALKFKLADKSDSMAQQLSNLTLAQLRENISEWQTNETAVLALKVCSNYVNEMALVDEDKQTTTSPTSNKLESRTISSLIASIWIAEIAKVSKWKAIMGMGVMDDTGWKKLASYDGRNEYVKHFSPPSKTEVQYVQDLSDQQESIENENKDLAGDDVMFVSVQIQSIQSELLKRQTH